MNIKKAQNDIVYFTEKVLGHNLQEWQKDFIRKYENREITLHGIKQRHQTHIHQTKKLKKGDEIK